jgi:transcription antitermination factor NusG
MSYWAVAQTKSQCEHVAANFLKQKSYETYLPRIIAKTGVRERVMPLFPTYLFVCIETGWWDARWSPHVLKLLMADDHPAVISDKIVCAIQRREGENGLVKLPKPPGIQRGTQVVIHGSNSFAGHVGIFDGMAAHDRVRVLLNLMGRSVPISVRTSDIRPIETKSTPCA